MRDLKGAKATGLIKKCKETNYKDDGKYINKLRAYAKKIITSAIFGVNKK